MGSSALQRRFLFGPLVALALLGPASDVTGDGGRVAPRPSGSPASPDPGRRAEDLLARALEAEQVYRVDHLVFASAVGGELEDLRALDPGLAWGSEVIVEVPASEGEDNLVVVLRAPLPDGSSLCLCEVTTEQDAGVWYARAAPAAACPRPGKGMPGWRADRSAGWGI